MNRPNKIEIGNGKQSKSPSFICNLIQINWFESNYKHTLQTLDATYLFVSSLITFILEKIADSHICLIYCIFSRNLFIVIFACLLRFPHSNMKACNFCSIFLFCLHFILAGTLINITLVFFFQIWLWSCNENWIRLILLMIISASKWIYWVSNWEKFLPWVEVDIFS